MLFSRCLVPAVVVVRLQLEALVVVVELEVVVVDRAARAAGARRRRGGCGLLAAALVPAPPSTGSEKLVAELSMSNAAELIDRSSSSSTPTLRTPDSTSSFAAIDWPTMRASSLASTCGGGKFICLKRDSETQTESTQSL